MDLRGGGEIADMCLAVPRTDISLRPMDFGFLVQRTWSNVAAAAGDDPCVPEPPDEPYFNSIPVFPDTITLSGSAAGVTNEGVRIPVGQSRTIDVKLLSDAPTSGPWTVSAMDFSAYEQTPQELAFTFDRTTGWNGDTLHMTINVLRQDTLHGVERFFITSTLGSRTTSWLGVVGN